MPVFQGAVGAGVRIPASKRLWAASRVSGFEGPSTAAADPAASIGRFEAVPPHPLVVITLVLAWASGGSCRSRPR